MRISGVLAAALAGLGLFFASAAPSLAGDKVTTLHAFDAAGYSPWAGIVADRRGDVLGTTTIGGSGPCTAGLGCGTVFRIAPPTDGGMGWRYQTLYNFQGGEDGYFPAAPVTPADDGAVYGYTGAGNFGAVFRLLPPSSPESGWRFQILYAFHGGTDGDLQSVYAPLILDQGHVYGIASGGGSRRCGASGCGSVFRLDPGAPGQPWTKEVLFDFAGGVAGGRPQWVAGLDATGSLYVSIAEGNGAVVQLSPPAAAGDAWIETAITSFAGGPDGRAPGDLILDPSGRLFGLAVGTRKAGNLVYQLTPPGEGAADRTRSVVAYVKDRGYGPASLALGAGGTLIGAIEGDFDFFAGALFQLSPPSDPSAPWNFTQLWNFNRGPDRNPLNAIVGRGGDIFSVLNGGNSTNGSVIELHRAAH